MNDNEHEEEINLVMAHDEQGVPVIPRFWFTVPYEYRKEFHQLMQDEVRSQTQLLRYIFIKHMRMLRAEKAAAEAANSQPEGGRRKIVHFGPTPPKSIAAQDGEHNSGEQ